MDEVKTGKQHNAIKLQETQRPAPPNAVVMQSIIWCVTSATAPRYSFCCTAQVMDNSSTVKGPHHDQSRVDSKANSLSADIVKSTHKSVTSERAPKRSFCHTARRWLACGRSPGCCITAAAWSTYLLREWTCRAYKVCSAQRYLTTFSGHFSGLVNDNMH